MQNRDANRLPDTVVTLRRAARLEATVGMTLPVSTEAWAEVSTPPPVTSLTSKVTRRGARVSAVPRGRSG